MDEFFTDQPFQTPQVQAYQPPQLDPTVHSEQPTNPSQQQNSAVETFNFTSYPPGGGLAVADEFEGGDNEFNEFEEDETTRRIREEEDRVQSLLKQKSQKEWQDKNERVLLGKKQLSDYQDKKQQEKEERRTENVRKEEVLRTEEAKLKVEAGWQKVISSINVRQGEHKGKQDINRMREAIIRKREDDNSRS